MRACAATSLCPLRIFARWEHRIGLSYSTMSLMKFVIGMLFAAHWVRRTAMYLIDCLGAITVAVVRLMRWVRCGAFYFVQIACIWRIVVDIEGDAFDSEAHSWVQGEPLLVGRFHPVTTI